MKVYEYMEQLKKSDSIIRNKQVELDMLYKTFIASKPLRIRLESELKSEIEALIRSKQEMIAIIEKLPEAEYEVLYGVYVQRLTLQEVADNADKSYSWAAQRKAKALKMMQKMIDEI